MGSIYWFQELLEHLSAKWLLDMKIEELDHKECEELAIKLEIRKHKLRLSSFHSILSKHNLEPFFENDKIKIADDLEGYIVGFKNIYYSNRKYLPEYLTPINHSPLFSKESYETIFSIRTDTNLMVVVYIDLYKIDNNWNIYITSPNTPGRLFTSYEVLEKRSIQR